tara:strand:- start:203 stop:970 length:768 start_codon:yes stop_codon:yes gene_type:complete
MSKRTVKDINQRHFYVISLRGPLDEKIQELVDAHTCYRTGEKNIPNIHKFLFNEQVKLFESEERIDASEQALKDFVEKNEMVPIVCEEFNYPSYYVNKKGQILKTFVWRDGVPDFKLISTFKNGLGYICFSFVDESNINEEGKSKDRRVYLHRVLAAMFVPNPENKNFVNHKDLDRSNNDISNLEWVTHKENLKHAREKGHHRKSKLTASNIREIKRKNKNKKVCEHINEKATKFGISRGYVEKIYYEHQIPVNL